MQKKKTCFSDDFPVGFDASSYKNKYIIPKKMQWGVRA